MKKLALSRRVCLAALVGFLWLVACTPADTAITGQVFIVTKSGGSIKLGLVPIRIYELSATAAELRAYQASIRQRLGEAMKERKAAQANVDAAKPQYEKMEKIWQDAKSGKYGTDQIIQGMAAKAFLSALNEYKPKLDRLTAAEVTVDSLIGSRAVLSHLGKPLAQTKTDGDGKFTVILKAGATYVLAALAHRELPEDENYVWAIKVTPIGKAPDILLSNDNLLGADTLNSAINMSGWIDGDPASFLQ